MRNTTLLALTAMVLSSCVVGPNYKPPHAALPAHYSEAGRKPTDQAPLNPWWEAFRDKGLNALVDQGMNENLGVRAALERIAQAQANVVIAGAGALPQVDAAAAATVAGATKARTTTTLTAGLGASWLLDFFGQYRRARESASASLDAAYDNIGVARLAFFSDLSQSYVDLRYSQESIAIARRNLASRRETLKLVTDLRNSGAASRLDVIQAEGLVNQTLSEIPGLDARFHQAANHIATLLAVPAATMTASLSHGYGQPVPRTPTDVGIPADLIRNRPDIRQAERLLAAATADVGVAEAQLYPSIALIGSINGSKTFTRSASHGLLSWSFGPSIDLPLFDGQTRRAEVKIARSNMQTQYIAWKATVLNAVEEVENAQIALHRDRQTVVALRRLVSSYQEALGLARVSYKAGTATVLDVLEAERNVADARVSLVAAIRQLAADYISLNVAVGGGAELGARNKSDLAQAGDEF